MTKCDYNLTQPAQSLIFLGLECYYLSLAFGRLRLYEECQHIMERRRSGEFRLHLYILIYLLVGFNVCARLL